MSHHWDKLSSGRSDSATSVPCGAREETEVAFALAPPPSRLSAFGGAGGGERKKSPHVTLEISAPRNCAFDNVCSDNTDIAVVAGNYRTQYFKIDMKTVFIVMLLFRLMYQIVLFECYFTF